MTFWNNPDAHPVRSFEFKVKLAVPGRASLEPHTVKSTTLPSFEISSQEYQVGNQWFKYPGVMKWNDITMTFVEDRETSMKILSVLREQRFADSFKVAKKGVLDGLRKGKINCFIYTHGVASMQVRKEPVMADGIFGIEYEKIPGGITRYGKQIVTTEYRLIDAWIKSVNFGTHDYGSDDLINIEVTIAYDSVDITHNEDPFGGFGIPAGMTPLGSEPWLFDGEPTAAIISGVLKSLNEQGGNWTYNYDMKEFIKISD